MALNVEIWKLYIQEKLFKDSEFLNYAKDASGEVIKGKIVHIPNAGDPPSVVRNRTNVPASVSKRTDSDVVYLLDEFTTDPTYIDNIEQVEMSYNKIDSVIGSHMNKLIETVGDWMIYNWLSKNASTSTTTPVAFAANTYVSCSGTSTGSGYSPNGQSLKSLAIADVAKARFIMNSNNVPKENRFLLLPSTMYDELIASLSATTVANNELIKAADLPAGVVMRLFGFNILERSSVALMTKSTPTIVAPGTTETSSHGYAAIAWQQDMVEKAVGDIQMFEKVGDPTVYGNQYSALVRAGGRAVYSSALGVVPIVQTA